MRPPSGAMPARCLKLRAALASTQPAIQRVAAEALGRIGDARAVPDLLAATAPKLDRTLEHSLTYALIEIADAAATRRGAARHVGADQACGTHRARSDDAAGPGAGRGRAASRFVRLGDEQDGVVDRRAPPRTGALNCAAISTSGWRRAAARPSARTWSRGSPQFSSNPAIEELLASLADGASSEARVTALRVMAASQARELPGPWIAPLSRALTSGHPDVIRAAVAWRARCRPLPTRAPR